MDRLYDRFGVGQVGLPVRRAPLPALNVWDNAESVFVEAEVLGVKPDDFEVYAVGNELTIKGRRRPMQGDKVVYQRQERGTGEFTRVITLPCEVNADKVDAVLKDGVLRIELPKTAAARPKQIAVKAS
jgi:HSP20 family protein